MLFYLCNVSYSVVSYLYESFKDSELITSVEE